MERGRDSENMEEEVEGRGGRAIMIRNRVCQFCVDKTKTIDYKNVETLRSLVSDRGKILPGRLTGNCAGHQRQLTVAIKRVRLLALLPFTVE